MAGDTVIIGNWNDTTPAAPAGHDNVKFQKDASTPPNISAHAPRADTAGTKYGTIIYDGSGNASRYLGADGSWHTLPAGSIPNGGTIGQVLAKASATDGDVEWADPGGAGGWPWDYDPPLASSFSLASGDATNLTLSDEDYPTGLHIDAGAPTSGDKNRIAYRVLSDPTLDWDMRARLRGFITATNYSGFGVIIYDSVGGKPISLTLRSDGQISTIKWTSLAGYTGNLILIPPRWVPFDLWFRATHTSNNYYFYYSIDGLYWHFHSSIADTSYTPNRANYVGLCMDYNRSYGQQNLMNCAYFSLTGPAV